MPEKSSHITGIILAGGKNSRMGMDKGLLQLDGTKLIERQIQVLSAVCSHLIIISNNEVYNDLGLPVYKDRYTDVGPLGGIFTGLFYSTTAYNFVLACDMPFVKEAVFDYLLEQADGYDIVVPSLEGRLQPLCALYRKQVCSTLEELILQGVWKMQQVIKRFHYKELAVNELDLDEKTFTNINTPAELQQIRNLYEMGNRNK